MEGRGISWPDEQLLASPERICSVKLASVSCRLHIEQFLLSNLVAAAVSMTYTRDFLDSNLGRDTAYAV
jgi:hypothetical protein